MKSAPIDYVLQNQATLIFLIVPGYRNSANQTPILAYNRSVTTKTPGIDMTFMRAITSGLLLIGIVSMMTACGSSSSSGSGNDGDGETRHRIFVTSSTYTGNLGGLIGADIICTNVAASAGISGSYQAVMSSSTESALSRLAINGEVYMFGTGGEVIVMPAGMDFWNSMLSNPINIDENETTLGAMQGPWTGTDPVGGTNIGQTCTDWTVDAVVLGGATGDTSTTSSTQWINANGFTCDESRPIYCIEE